MKLFLDILQGAGVAAAAGLRPFLPALLVGALGAADLGVDFDGTELAFLESPWWLLAMAAGLVAATLGRRFTETPMGESALSGLSIGIGGLLCAGTIDDRHDTWWYGLLIGAAVALLASVVSRSLFARVRARFAAAGDQSAAAALPWYAEAAGVVIAGASVLFPPLAILAIAFLFALLITGRRREGQKYAGLRILR